MSKSATVYAVDVGKSMGQRHNGRTITDLEWAVKWVQDEHANWLLTQRKIDAYSFVAFRTNTTSYRGRPETFASITEFGRAQLDVLREAKEDYKPSVTEEGDSLVKYILECMQLQDEFVGTKAFERIIWVVTNATCEPDWDTEKVKQLVAKAERLKVHIKLHAIDFDVIAAGRKVEGDTEQESQNRLENYKNLHLLQKRLGKLLEIQNFIDVSNAMIMAPLRYPNPTIIGGRNSGDMPLMLGKEGDDSSLHLTVRFYPFVRGATQKTAKQVVKRANGSTSEVKRVTDYKREEEDLDENEWADVAEEDRVQGYRLGKSVVPIDSVLGATMQGGLDEERKIEIMGFVPRSEFKVWRVLDGDTNYIAAATPKDQLAISAIVEYLLNEHLYCIARVVVRAGGFGENARMEAKPMLLVPHGDQGRITLVTCALPFKDDVRPYQFPSLMNPKTVSVKSLEPSSTEYKQRVPTDKMNRLFGDLIDNMMLAPKTEDDDQTVLAHQMVDRHYGQGVFDSTLIPDLVKARYRQCLKHCIANGVGADDLPPVPEEYTKWSKPFFNDAQEAKTILDELTRELEIEKVLSAKEQREMVAQSRAAAGESSGYVAAQSAALSDQDIEALIAGTYKPPESSTKISGFADLEIANPATEVKKEASTSDSFSTENLPEMPSKITEENYTVDFRNRLEGFAARGNRSELISVCNEVLGVVVIDIGSKGKLTAMNWEEFLRFYKITTETWQVDGARELLDKYAEKAKSQGIPVFQKKKFIRRIAEVYEEDD